jgi:hypothetical protein
MNWQSMPEIEMGLRQVLVLLVILMMVSLRLKNKDVNN